MVNVDEINASVEGFQKAVEMVGELAEISKKASEAVATTTAISRKMEGQLHEMQELHEKLDVAVNSVKDSNKETAGEIRRDNATMRASVKNDCTDMVIEVEKNSEALVSAVTKGTAQMVSDIKESNAALTRDVEQVAEKANQTLENIGEESKKSAEGFLKLEKRVDESLDTIEGRVRENSRLVESSLDQLYTQSNSSKKEMLDCFEKLDRKTQHDLDIRFKAVADLKEENTKLKEDIAKLGLYVKICGIGVAATLIATIIHFFI